MKVTTSILLFLVASLVLPFSVQASRGLKPAYLSPSGDAVTGVNWLFVIGINDYGTWPKLQTAVNDATSLRNVLLERYRYDPAHILELYDDQATRKNIIGNLRFLAKNVQANDSLVIFYAGHGHIDSITKEGSWIPVNSDMENSASWISNHEIKQYLTVDAIKAKHVLLVSDSCFSGDFFRGRRGKLPAVTPAVIKKAYKLTSRQAIASGGLEPVSDGGFGSNSVFSHFFIKALEENSDPFITPSVLFPDIKAGVAENAEQFPTFGSLTGTGGQQGGEFVFFLKQDIQLKELSSVAAEKAKELERLKKLEQEERLANTREKAEIAQRKDEIAALDTQIAAMKKRLGTTSEKKDDSLRAMLTMVRQKEEQQTKLDALNQKKAAENATRRAEIVRLRKQAAEKERAELESDIRDYNEIIASDYGLDMADSAWQFLVKKYPVRAEGVKKGDVTTLASPGTLKIHTSPRGAGVVFEMMDRGYVEGMALEPGDYDVTVSAEGYYSKRVQIHMKAGQSNRVYVDLERGFENSIGMTFVYIKPGTFKMGSKKSSDYAKPVHTVTLTRGFYMQTTEVTQRQWKDVMRTNPSINQDCGDECPVEHVSWNDAKEFIKRLNGKEGTDTYRLPTEAEWEYACRAGSKTPYANGNSLDDMGWYGKYGSLGTQTQPVAGKKANNWGLYDMHGNVQEWCEDWHDDYGKEHLTDPSGPSTGIHRVQRGGDTSSSDESCTAAVRDSGNPERGFLYDGFRLVKTP
ncbi:hypothetical protein DSLASN_13060 [Desulfoluna limicola]|uniref:Caspase family p20 domain-containing protein n=1 Tax=Desulfoluna limicola TaxID=2810562 RepID=A0ABN6EZD5_9BACT|nr:SUMF1/EgtB/PvdO family nonheme iron enzyme [Desulfoluna limicola]BCS95674.1 hypothetical protein DSLASN_13060 [Desulfoluna limicola]